MHTLTYRNSWLFLCCISLSACSLTTIAPVEQLHQKIEISQLEPQNKITPNRDIVKKQIVTSYLCEKSQSVRIQSTPDKNNLIRLTFNNITHVLSPVVTGRGKRYSNIRWIWVEDLNGIGILSDNRNNILATGCIQKGD